MSLSLHLRSSIVVYMYMLLANKISICYSLRYVVFSDISQRVTNREQ